MTIAKLAMLFSLVTLLIVLWLKMEAFYPQRSPIPKWTPGEKAWVIKRMQYHGIEASIYDGKEYYFYREGKRCQL